MHTEDLRFAEFISGWPTVRVRLTRLRNPARPQSALQIRKLTWHAHVPRAKLQIPPEVRISAEQARGLVRVHGEEFSFDFSYLLEPLPNDPAALLKQLVDQMTAVPGRIPRLVEQLRAELASLSADVDKES